MGQIVPVKSDSSCLCSGGGGSCIQWEAGRDAAACFCIRWRREEVKEWQWAWYGHRVFFLCMKRGGFWSYTCAPGPLILCAAALISAAPRAPRVRTGLHLQLTTARLIRINLYLRLGLLLRFGSQWSSLAARPSRPRLEWHEWRSQLLREAVDPPAWIRSAAGHEVECHQSVFPHSCVLRNAVAFIDNWIYELISRRWDYSNVTSREGI